MTASCMTCIYSQLTKEQYPCSECYYDNNGNPSKHEPVVEAPDINVGNMDTTTHDSIPAETGKNDGEGTSGDCISRAQAIDALRKMQTYKLFAGDDMLLIDQAEAQTELMMLLSIQPEPEAISKWKKEFREYVDSLDIARDDWKGIIEYIDELPSAQPERPRGHWVEIGDEPYDEWECDVCGFAIDGSGCIDPEEYRDVYKFCPNCGVDMRGEQE